MLAPFSVRNVTVRILARTRRMTKQSRKMASKPPDSVSRVDRIAARMPRILRRYMEPLRNAPLTHISAFLLLHELTAIVPLFGLAGLFHYYNYLPPYISEGELVAKGVEKFGNYFRRKGWLGDLDTDPDVIENGRAKWWGRGEGSIRIVTEFATAYAITKVLLPLRLVLSVWGTPWFARVVVTPFTNGFGRLFKRTPKASKTALTPPSAASNGSGAAGTGATEANLVQRK